MGIFLPRSSPFQNSGKTLSPDDLPSPLEGYTWEKHQVNAECYRLGLKKLKSLVFTKTWKYHLTPFLTWAFVKAFLVSSTSQNSKESPG